jgi:hypothetical protein
VTTERYIVPDFWRPSENGESLEASVHAPEISQLVSAPSTAVRTMPLAVSHPVNVSCHVSVRLRGDWDLPAQSRRIETEAVRFGYDSHYAGSVLDLYYDYETLADSVPPEKALAHVEKVGRILDVTQYSITRPADGEEDEEVEDGEGTLSSGMTESDVQHWVMIFFYAAVSFVLTATISATLFFYRPKAPPDGVPLSDADLQGIKGWLAFACIGILISPLIMLWNVIQTLPAFEPSTWATLTSKTSASYHELWAPVLLVELFAHIAMFNVSVVLAALFLMRRRAFPRLFIVCRIGWVLFLLVDSVVAGKLPEVEQGIDPKLGGMVCATVPWVLYFLKSRRVRATFVR